MITFATKIGRGHVLLTRGFTNFPLLCLQSWVIKKFGCMPKKVTTKDFIEKARLIHGDTYDYSETNYVAARLKVKIRCKKHGLFEQTANAHLNGQGCPVCGELKKKHPKRNLQDVINDCKKLHGDQYTYEKSKENYIDTMHNVVVTCKDHGDFVTKFNYVLRNIYCCPECYKEHLSKVKARSQDEFIKLSIEKYGNRFGYDLVNYKNSQTKVKILCPKHGLFEITPNAHLQGGACPKCAIEENADRCRSNTEEFIEKAKKIHGDRYGYDAVDYINNHTPVVIYCKKHGNFKQTPQKHLCGCGCPHCSLSKGENVIENYLELNNIKHQSQYKIKNTSLLCGNKYSVCDFYLPDYNTIIEYNGEQHYRETYFHRIGRRSFLQQQERDVALRQYCNENKIKLIEIPYTEYDNIEAILEKELK